MMSPYTRAMVRFLWPTRYIPADRWFVPTARQVDWRTAVRQRHAPDYADCSSSCSQPCTQALSRSSVPLSGSCWNWSRCRRSPVSRRTRRRVSRAAVSRDSRMPRTVPPGRYYRHALRRRNYERIWSTSDWNLLTNKPDATKQLLQCNVNSCKNFGRILLRN